MRQRGMDLMKGELGTVNAVSNNGKKRFQSRRRVLFVVRTILRTWQIPCIAPSNALTKQCTVGFSRFQKNVRGVVKHSWQTVIPRLKHVLTYAVTDDVGLHKEKFFLKNIAHSVMKNSNLKVPDLRLSAVPVNVQLEKVGPTDVYNLTLEKHNAYYANEILVYNCLTFSQNVLRAPRTAQGTHRSEYNPLSMKYVKGFLKGFN
jgi:hypothetical protein